MEHSPQPRKRGPVESQPVESSGTSTAETPPESTPSADAPTSDSPSVPENAPVVPQEATTPAMGELEQRIAEKAAAEPERPPHPYKWRIEAEAMIPFGFRDPANGQPSKERIEAHIEECWRAETPPSIAGVLVTLPRRDS